MSFGVIMEIYKTSFGIAVVFAIAMIILLDIGKAACLKKAGEKYWKGFVPFYNTYLMYKIVGLKGWFVSVEIAQVVISAIVLMMTAGMLNDIGDIVEDIEDSRWNSRDYSYDYHYDYDYDYDEDFEDLVKEYVGKTVILNLISSALGILALILAIFYAIKISKAFGKGGGYIAGMILVPLIFTMIIGLGSSKYIGNYVSKEENIN